MHSDQAKRVAAQAALDALTPHLRRDTVLGIGTGTTVNCFIEALAKQRPSFAGAVVTSESTEARLRQQAVRILSLNDARPQFYIDGTDEVDAKLHLIKGGGGALTLEKIVATASEKFICIADTSKFVSQLGAFPLPVEVMQQAREAVAKRLIAMNGLPELRASYRTEHNNQILRVRGLSFADPLALESAINDIPGVICCGIFAARPADELYLGDEKTAEKIVP